MAPSHYLNQCWDIVNWTPGNKLQWNFNHNSNIFIQENAFENVVCEMASILSRPQCVNSLWTGGANVERQHLITVVSGNGLWSVRHQAITWNNTNLLSIQPPKNNLQSPKNNFFEILNKIWESSFNKKILKMLSANCWTFWSGLAELT